jgi:acyl dehydratase
VAEVEYSGKKYRFTMPSCLPDGVTMEVDNLSCRDSAGITLRKNGNESAEMLGVAVLSNEK